MIRLRSDRNVFRSSIRCAEPDCEGLCCPPSSVSSPWRCQICQAERSSQQVVQNNANCCNRMHIRSHFRTCVTFTWQGGWADVLCGGGYGRFGLLQRSTPTRADDQQACFFNASVTCNYKLDNISVSIQRYWDHPVLHPNHYLVVELCHSLVFAYAVLRLVDFCSASSLWSKRRT